MTSFSASENDRRILQEKLDASREGLNEVKKQNHSLIEKVQSLSAENGELQLRNSEIEGQLRQANTLLCQRQEGEQELMQQINKLHKHPL